MTSTYIPRKVGRAKRVPHAVPSLPAGHAHTRMSDRTAEIAMRPGGMHRHPKYAARAKRAGMLAFHAFLLMLGLMLMLIGLALPLTTAEVLRVGLFMMSGAMFTSYVFVATESRQDYDKHGETRR